VITDTDQVLSPTSKSHTPTPGSSASSMHDRPEITFPRTLSNTKRLRGCLMGSNTLRPDRTGRSLSQSGPRPLHFPSAFNHQSLLAEGSTRFTPGHIRHTRTYGIESTPTSYISSVPYRPPISKSPRFKPPKSRSSVESSKYQEDDAKPKKET
jgi:hypothetical protein